MGLKYLDIDSYKDESLEERHKALFEQYLPVVHVTVQRMRPHIPSSVETQDLISAGIVGLLDAITRLRPEREASFGAYVSVKVRCAILSELRSRDYISRGMRQKGRLVEETYGRLELELGREASQEEVARELGIDLEELQEIERLSEISLLSWDELQGIVGERDIGGLVEEVGERLVDDIFVDEVFMPLAKAIGELDQREQLVLSLYYVEELTMKEIAQVLGLTESRISQIHSKAIRQLRAKLRSRGLIGDKRPGSKGRKVLPPEGAKEEGHGLPDKAKGRHRGS